MGRLVPGIIEPKKATGNTLAESHTMREKSLERRKFDLKSTNTALHNRGHEKKMPYFPLYKLLNRDPYNGLL